MDPATLAAVIGALATVAAAFIGKNWGERQGEQRGERVGRKKERDAWHQALQAAPKQYSERLGSLIERADSAPNSEVVVHARAIVATRDDLRGSLTSLAGLLNSEIDRLSTQIVDASSTDASVDDLRKTVQVLKLKWPAKKEQVEVELRKLMAELGLERRGERG